MCLRVFREGTCRGERGGPFSPVMGARRAVWRGGEAQGTVLAEGLIEGPEAPGRRRRPSWLVGHSGRLRRHRPPGTALRPGRERRTAVAGKNGGARIHQGATIFNSDSPECLLLDPVTLEGPNGKRLHKDRAFILPGGTYGNLGFLRPCRRQCLIDGKQGVLADVRLLLGPLKSKALETELSLGV